MIKLMALSSILIQFSLALAADSPHSTAGGADDLLGVTKVPDELSGENTQAVRIAITCTNSDGNVLRSDDPGYDRCLTEAQSKNKKTGVSSLNSPTLKKNN